MEQACRTAELVFNAAALGDAAPAGAARAASAGAARGSEDWAVARWEEFSDLTFASRGALQDAVRALAVEVNCRVEQKKVARNGQRVIYVCRGHILGCTFTFSFRVSEVTKCWRLNSSATHPACFVYAGCESVAKLSAKLLAQHPSFLKIIAATPGAPIGQLQTGLRNGSVTASRSIVYAAKDLVRGDDDTKRTMQISHLPLALQDFSANNDSAVSLLYFRNSQTQQLICLRYRSANGFVLEDRMVFRYGHSGVVMNDENGVPLKQGPFCDVPVMSRVIMPNVVHTVESLDLFIEQAERALPKEVEELNEEEETKFAEGTVFEEEERDDNAFVSATLVGSGETAATMQAALDAMKEMPVNYKFEGVFVAFTPFIKIHAAAGSNVVCFDAGHLTRVQGKVIVMGSSDSNHRNVPLMLGIAGNENEAAYLRAMAAAKAGGFVARRNLVVGSDRGAAVLAAISRFYPMARKLNCLVHILRNFATNGFKLTQKHKAVIIRLAKQRTKERFADALAKARCFMPQGAMDYLCSIPLEHWTWHSFLEAGISIDGQITSNMAETMMSWLLRGGMRAQTGKRARTSLQWNSRAS
jgi:hypothetical protein